MVINVSFQCNDGLPPDIILLTLCDSIGETFQHHVKILSLQPMFPPTRVNRLIIIVGRFRCVQIFL